MYFYTNKSFPIISNENITVQKMNTPKNRVTRKINFTVFHSLSDDNQLVHVILQRYFLSRCRKACISSGDQLPPGLQWLSHPEGYRFFVSGKWHMGGRDSLFTTLSSQGMIRMKVVIINL